jgi:hypothetical protein
VKTTSSGCQVSRRGPIGRFLDRSGPGSAVAPAPVRVNGRIEALVGAERHQRNSTGVRLVLNRLASVLAQDLTRREEDG